MKLTKTIVEKLKLPASGQVLLWDDDVKGFGLRLTPTTKTYIVQSRVKGISRRISLGRHGVTTLHEARKKAINELAGMNAGKDPILEKKRAASLGKTLQAVSEQYLADRRDLKATSRADINKHLKTSFATWADKPIIDITRDMVAKRFTELSERSLSQANQAFRILRAIINYAMGKYRTDKQPFMIENPVKVLSDMKVWNRVKARLNRIPTDKIGSAWNEIQKLKAAPEGTDLTRTLADIVAFLLLTGCRWTEAASLTWNNVKIDEASWHITDPKNRNPVTFPLSMVAVDLLRQRQNNAGYVFPGRLKDSRITECRSVLSKLSNIAGLKISPHDLRRTFRAIAGECGIELWKTKLLMNHRLSQDVTITHYTETNDLRYLTKEINLISNWITSKGAVAGKDNVLPFQRRDKTA